MIKTGILLLVGLLLTGCNSPRMMTKKVSDIEVNKIKPVKPVELVVSDKLNDIEKMERCRRELEALKRVDIRIYNQRKAEFDRVMQGADIYSGVRSDVRVSTQDAVDAYYRYRVDKMCADISKNVLDSLSDNK
ncbi:hypothetical protein K4C27_003644 [Escherichia coli]|uniref:hypothetical protein n=1 Tax=Escherichia TaxID=561 RepID=UPI0015D6DFFD|nr:MULTISPECIES: hypothetical protein [Escherichia]EHY3137003.1 hypothetical protein [Escherichia coli]MBA7736654.1 hypothetical protein [Escherichia marmotae]MBA7955153.1 hypothetical protein [Escherichia marmotae]MCI5375045.1 hypothetical protein [Escherichia coli]